MNKANKLLDTKTTRHLFAIDGENVLGTGVLNESLVGQATTKLGKLHGPQDADLMVVEASHKNNVFPVNARVPSARIVFRPGKDGTDRALRDVLKKERVSERFDKVTLISRDGILAPDAEHLTQERVRVVVTARKHSFSLKLAQKASKILHPGIKRAA